MKRKDIRVGMQVYVQAPNTSWRGERIATVLAEGPWEENQWFAYRKQAEKFIVIGDQEWTLDTSVFHPSNTNKNGVLVGFHDRADHVDVVPLSHLVEEVTAEATARRAQIEKVKRERAKRDVEARQQRETMIEDVNARLAALHEAGVTTQKTRAYQYQSTRVDVSLDALDELITIIENTRSTP